MSGHTLAQMPHCLHCWGEFTTTFPVSRNAKTSAGQNDTHRPQFLHHGSKISTGSVLILSGKGTCFFRRAGRESIISAVIFFCRLAPGSFPKPGFLPAIAPPPSWTLRGTVHALSRLRSAPSGGSDGLRFLRDTGFAALSYLYHLRVVPSRQFLAGT